MNLLHVIDLSILYPFGVVNTYLDLASRIPSAIDELPAFGPKTLFEANAQDVGLTYFLLAEIQTFPVLPRALNRLAGFIEVLEFNKDTVLCPNYDCLTAVIAAIAHEKIFSPSVEIPLPYQKTSESEFYLKHMLNPSAHYLQKANWRSETALKMAAKML